MIEVALFDTKGIETVLNDVVDSKIYVGIVNDNLMNINLDPLHTSDDN